MGHIPKGTHYCICVSPSFVMHGRSALCICEARICFIPKGACLRLDAVHAAASRMDTVSIVNGNVCGRFRDVLAPKVLFLQVHDNASLDAK
jgi:hypothetical protein